MLLSALVSALHYFNSIKVQLEPNDMQRYYTDFMLFQFHKGTIRTETLKEIEMYCPYFNSIKVQLELVYVIIPLSLYLFQFHKGTIRTLLLLFLGIMNIKFQFHKGTIRTWYT